MKNTRLIQQINLFASKESEAIRRMTAVKEKLPKFKKGAEYKRRNYVEGR